MDATADGGVRVGEVAVPDLSRWELGNTGIPYVWRFRAEISGPHVVVQALTHGNEVCGAIVLDWLLDQGFRPERGSLTLVFANVSAFARLSPTDPYASRYVDEDFNRLWSAEALDRSRPSVELSRARVLRSVYDQCEFLLDLHSFNDPCLPLMLAGRRPKGIDLARAVGIPAHIVLDEGHAAGKRLRDYAFFDVENDPRCALLVECGQHWQQPTVQFAQEVTLRFLNLFGMVTPTLFARHVKNRLLPPQRIIQVTTAVTIRSGEFAFVMPVAGLDLVPAAGTLIARDGEHEVRTPHDNCVLLMPTRNPKPGATAVRFGRYQS